MDQEVVALLREIRDGQKVNIACFKEHKSRYEEALKYQQTALAVQKKAVILQRVALAILIFALGFIAIAALSH